MSLRRGLAAIALCLLLPGAAPAADSWVEVRSPHFTVVTDAGEKRGRDVATRLEQMREAFGVLVGRSKVSIPIPVEVIAFRSTKEIRQYTPLFNGKPIELSGYYMGGSDRNYIALDLSANNALEAIFHEYAHMLLNGNYPPMPLWFDEGFAQYYETIRIEHKTIHLGEAPESAGYVFRSFSFMPIDQLISVEHGSRAYNESGDRRNIFYLESWLFVHYIYDHKKLKETGQYAELVEREHVPPVEALQRAFGVTPKQQQKELESYLHSMTVWTYTLSEEIQPTDFTARPLGATDAAVILADLHLHEPDYQVEAVKQFETVLQADPSNSGAHRGLGYSYLRKGDLQKAGEQFQLAARDTTDARVLYYSALLGRMRGPLEPGDVEDMKQKATRAIALEPEFADAYSLLAYADTTSGDLDSGLVAIKKAIALSPRNEAYALQFGQILVMEKKWDDATAVLTSLKASSNLAVAGQAEQALELVGRARSMQEVRIEQHGESFEVLGKEPPVVREEKVPEGPAPRTPSDTRPIQFLKGTLVGVDCSVSPGVTLRVSSGVRTWTFHAADRSNIVLIGADALSCDWKGLKVAVNYRPRGAAEGDLFSLEIQ